MFIHSVFFIHRPGRYKNPIPQFCRQRRNPAVCVCVCDVFYLQLLGEVVGDDGSEGGEQGSEEHTDVADVNSDVKKM